MFPPVQGARHGEPSILHQGTELMSQPNPSSSAEVHGLPEQILNLADSLGEKVRTSLKQIDDINTQSSLLSLNAKIEAARAGAAGRSFAVVATEMGELSETTKRVAVQLSSKLGGDIAALQDISQRLASDVLGTRLADLALTNIDLIDRNLYERSCDVRWWATDSSVVDLLTDPTPERVEYACKRLGVILNAYTVYFDLVVCGLNGEVLANGRPQTFKSIGMNVSKQRWFQSALQTRSGDEFGFEIVHASPLVDGAYILGYSCAVRSGGEADGQPIGVLGILFNWRGLAQTVVRARLCPGSCIFRSGRASGLPPNVFWKSKRRQGICWLPMPRRLDSKPTARTGTPSSSSVCRGSFAVPF